LEGAQGTGKSTAIAILAGTENHSDQDILTLDSKGQVEMLEGVWLYEIGELEGLGRADVAKVKAFASRRTDRARMAYAYFREDRARECIFIGTTNDGHYLTDQTGNRRFWPVKTGRIDLEALKRDRDQLWAEAVHREAQGEPNTLPEPLWEAAATQQAARTMRDPWLDILESESGQETNGTAVRVSSSHLLTNLLQIEPGRQKPSDQTRLGVCMRLLGWDGPKRMRIQGQNVRGYERPQPEGWHAKADLRKQSG
jgi:predicted P-loop ATPase